MIQHVDISVILPCHNEVNSLKDSIKEITTALGAQTINFELIIMEDGSSDGTRELGEALAAEHQYIHFHHHDQRLGRGKAVSEGIRRSRGKVAGFIDTDLQTPAKYIVECYREIERGADAVETIRIYQHQSGLGFYVRQLFSVGYQVLFRLMFGLKLKDTLAGCKFFNREAILLVLDELQDNHWFWDTEVMVLSHYLGLKIVEIPSEFLPNTDDVRESKTKLISDSLDFLVNLWKLRLRIKRQFKK